MNICIFTRTTLAHSIGGMEVHTDLLAKGLARQGHAVIIITTGDKNGKVSETMSGVIVHYLAGTKPGKYSRKWYRQSVKKFRELHDQQPFDIAFSESAGAFGLLRSSVHRKTRVPVVIIFHGIFYNEIKTRFNLGFSLKTLAAAGFYLGTYIFREMLLVGRATAVIATSQEQKHLIKKFYFLPENKVFTVFNGIETKITPPDASLKQNLGFAAGDRIILSVARLKKEKGLQVILNALPEILVDIPDARLLILGDGEYRGCLEKLASDLGLLGKVIFTGAVPYEELGKYFHLADVFVNSTIRENGYDLTIIQGMAYSKPVIVSRLKSLAGVIDDGKNGFLVGRGEVKELSRTVRKVLQDPQLAIATGAAAQQQAQSLFSVENMVNNTIKVLEKCLTFSPK
ncbi:MAG: glycosyltransferase family 4 protein [bacterium]|nr:glycosyltransferase family 4 protein [bacterium]MDD5755701.1 glycosyltransferase family 4 protein [bacterium]